MTCDLSLHDFIWRHRNDLNTIWLTNYTHTHSYIYIYINWIQTPCLTLRNVNRFQLFYDMCVSQSSHYNDGIMGVMASQITSLTIVYWTVYSGVDQRKHQSSASLAFEREIHRWPVHSPHKWPVTRKMFRFDDVILTFVSRMAPSQQR